MTMYKESMRRLARMGVALMLLTLIATVIYAVMDCDANKNTVSVASALQMTPALGVYAYIGGVGLAFTGFSFLRKRPDSDFYHSIPVKRSDLFLSITAASATWMLLTTATSAVAATLVYLFTGTPFVPAYPFMNVLFFFSAALLVYAAAAIGCSLTGTLVTNAVLTGLVLFLPRYILFMIGRTLVADTGLMGWLDLRGLLDPSTNSATGLVVMLSRRMYLGKIVNLPGTFWSLFVAALELFLGGVLFVKRPSELSDHSAGNHALQVLYACLLTFPLLLVFMLRPDELTPIFVVMIFTASLAVYIIYQVIAVRNTQRILLSLPWYIAVVALSVVALFGTRFAARQVQSASPDIAEVAYVSFPGEDRDRSSVSYASLCVSEIRFTERSVKQYVIETLRENITMMQTDGYLKYSEYSTAAPVRIVLDNGRTLCRWILFGDGDKLNACLRENPSYCEAITATPPLNTVRVTGGYLYSEYLANTEEINALTACYFEECAARPELVPYYAHHTDRFHAQADANIGGRQSLDSFNVGGYRGISRYSDSYTITLETPKTAALWMRLCNENADEQNLSRLKNAYQVTQTEGFLNNGGDGYFDLRLAFINFPGKDGMLRQLDVNYWDYGTESAATYTPELSAYLDELLELICRGEKSEDPAAMSVQIIWSLYYQGSSFDSSGSAYYGYSAADAARIMELVNAWNRALGNELAGIGEEGAVG